jgi:hypothetical protein
MRYHLSTLALLCCAAALEVAGFSGSVLALAGGMTCEIMFWARLRVRRVQASHP